MTDASATIEFAPVAAGKPTHWRRPASYAFARQIPHVPLSDSEILNTSHQLPIVIDYGNDGPRVVAITNPRFHRAPMTGADGKWLRGYMPICLRCFPFRLLRGPGDNTALEVAGNLGDAGQPELPMFAADGTLTPEVKNFVGLLRRLETGKQALQKSAEMLLIADVLTSFQMANLPGATPAHRYLTVDRNKFAALSNSRVAHLVRDGFLPIDLAAACIFSQRLMPTLVSVAFAAPHRAEREKTIETEIDHLVSDLALTVQVDDGELFSFERYEGMIR
jgi:hypothetical protein